MTPMFLGDTVWVKVCAVAQWSDYAKDVCFVIYIVALHHSSTWVGILLPGSPICRPHLCACQKKFSLPLPIKLLSTAHFPQGDLYLYCMYSRELWCFLKQRAQYNQRQCLTQSLTQHNILLFVWVPLLKPLHDISLDEMQLSAGSHPTCSQSQATFLGKLYAFNFVFI